LLKSYISQLRPGGYIELHDFCLPSLSMGDFPIEESKFCEYNNYMMESTKRMGIDMSAPKQWKEMLQAAGFTNIFCEWYNWPVGAWAKGKKNKLIGKLLHQNLYKGADTVAPVLTRVLQWDKEKADKFIEEVRAEMREGKFHLYCEICYWYAKKPETARTSESAC
jgi:hypothetical protein